MAQHILSTSFIMYKWVGALQEMDSSYQKYGIPKPFENPKISPQNLLYLMFSGAKKTNKNSLKTAFIDMLEQNFCRSVFQKSIDILEKILSQAVAEYGLEWVVSSTDELNVGFARAAHEFIPDLQKAGFSLKNPELLERIINSAQEKAKKTITVDEPVWLSNLKCDTGVYQGLKIP